MDVSTTAQHKGAEDDFGESFCSGIDNLELGDFTQAIADFTEEIRLKPDCAVAYRYRAVAYSKQDDFCISVADFTKAIELLPNDAEAYLERGIIYARLECFDRAEADFTKAIELILDSVKASVHQNVGGIVLESSEQELADFKKALGRLPEITDANFNQSELNKVLSEFSAKTGRRLSLARAYTNRGKCHVSRRRYTQAVDDFTKVIEMNPDDAGPYVYRATARLQDFPKAIADFTRAIELNPNFAGAYFGRGIIYLNQDKFDLAAADFTKVLEITPENTKASEYREAAIRKEQNQD